MSTTVEKPLSDDVIRRALSEFNVSVSPGQVACIQSFIRLLRQWNEKLNLTAIRDPLEILHRHFCESMFAATAIPLSSGRLADIGSGPGFPGLPLKIIQPELDVFLVESNIKKGTFIAEVIRELGLNGARVLISRYEELGEEVAPLDYVCSRALGEFEAFLNWAASDRVAAGKVILWVGGRDLEDVRKSVLWDWQEPIAIPNSLRRFLLVGTKKPRLSA
ncbi:MAG TPA: 16S rRNA (guanine(527)-N(7))-methyltransferase RsmG [Candidatus Acidoferrum sp.]